MEALNPRETTALTETATTTFDAAKRAAALNERIIKVLLRQLQARCPFAARVRHGAASKKIGGWELVRAAFTPITSNIFHLRNDELL